MDIQIVFCVDVQFPHISDKSSFPYFKFFLIGAILPLLQSRSGWGKISITCLCQELMENNKLKCPYRDRCCSLEQWFFFFKLWSFMVHSNRMLTINPKHGLDVHAQYSAVAVCPTTPDCLLHPYCQECQVLWLSHKKNCCPWVKCCFNYNVHSTLKTEGVFKTWECNF